MVFVYCEQDSNIKRWTDGKLWTPSRIRGNFLVYKQLEKKVSRTKDAQYRDLQQQLQMKQQGFIEIDGKKAWMGSKGTCIFMDPKASLIKKTISIVIDGKSKHLVSYRRKGEMLPRPCDDPILVAIPLSPEMYTYQHFRNPVRPSDPNNPFQNLISDDESDSPLSVPRSLMNLEGCSSASSTCLAHPGAEDDDGYVYELLNDRTGERWPWVATTPPMRPRTAFPDAQWIELGALPNPDRVGLLRAVRSANSVFGDTFPALPLTPMPFTDEWATTQGSPWDAPTAAPAPLDHNLYAELPVPLELPGHYSPLSGNIAVEGQWGLVASPGIQDPTGWAITPTHAPADSWASITVKPALASAEASTVDPWADIMVDATRALLPFTHNNPASLTASTTSARSSSSLCSSIMITTPVLAPSPYFSGSTHAAAYGDGNWRQHGGAVQHFNAVYLSHSDANGDGGYTAYHDGDGAVQLKQAWGNGIPVVGGLDLAQPELAQTGNQHTIESMPWMTAINHSNSDVDNVCAGVGAGAIGYARAYSSSEPDSEFQKLLLDQLPTPPTEDLEAGEHVETHTPPMFHLSESVQNGDLDETSGVGELWQVLRQARDIV
ncbi:hypothetical protein HK101_002122 [Irineochytrium annulatum]|nr:hypothetical protein HK101_002122 [Irineochytrium annulatum]